MEITKGENANLAGMEPRCPNGHTGLKLRNVEGYAHFVAVQCPTCLPDGTYYINELSDLAQFFRSPAPTPPLDVEAEKRIAEIRERERNATKGPLVAGLDLPFVDNNDPDKRMVWSNSLMVADFRSVWIKQEQSEADAEFYAHSRQDIPFLLEQRDFLLEQISLLRRHIASPAPQYSRTYGDLPGSIRNMVESHEWDGKNISEQRDYALDMVDFLERELGNFRRNQALAASPAQPEKAKGCPECSNPLIPMLACSDFKSCSSLWHVDDPRITNIPRPIEPEPTPASKTEIDSFAEHLATGISGFNNFKGKAGIIDWIRYQAEAWKAAQPLPAPPQSGKEGQS